MKKKKLIASACAALVALACSTPVSACDLSKEELLEKYQDYYEIKPFNQRENLSCDSYCGFDVTPEDNRVILRTGETACFTYDVLEDGIVRITGLNPDADPATEVLTVPAEIEGLPVTEIGVSAFERASDQLPALSEFQLPDCIETISARAFYQAFGGPLYKRILQTHHPYCDGTINIPQNLKAIGVQAFYDCADALADEHRFITLPETMEYASFSAFGWQIYSRARGGFEVILPESLMFLSDDKFHNTVPVRYRNDGWCHVDGTRRVLELAGNLPDEDIPLLKSYWGDYDSGFFGTRNIVSLKDVIWAQTGYTEEENTEHIVLKCSYLYTEHEGIPTAIEQLREAAAINAPDLLVSAPSAEPKPQTSGQGDINADGTVNLADAILLARIVAEDTTLTLPAFSAASADINGDGLLSHDDLTRLLSQLSNQ